MLRAGMMSRVGGLEVAVERDMDGGVVISLFGAYKSARTATKENTPTETIVTARTLIVFRFIQQRSDLNTAYQLTHEGQMSQTPYLVHILFTAHPYHYQGRQKGSLITKIITNGI
jgi:hypothetical protein